MLVVTALLNFPKPAEGIYWLTGEVASLYSVAPLAWLVAAELAGSIPGFSEITALLAPLVALGGVAALRSRRVGEG